MKEDKIYRSLEFVREEYLDSAANAMESGQYVYRFRRSRIWIIAAACLVLAVALVVLPIYNMIKPPVTNPNDVPPNIQVIHFTASEIAEVFKGAPTENAGTNQYGKVFVSDANELKIKQFTEQEYLPIYEYCHAEKELSEDEFAELMGSIVPRLSSSLKVSVPDYEISFEKDLYQEGEYDQYCLDMDLGANYRFNASQLKKYDCIFVSTALHSSRKMYLDGEQITARLSHSDEEIIASLESIKEKLFVIFGVEYTDVKVRRRYSSSNENKVDGLYVYYYNGSEHTVRPFLGNKDSNYIAIEFDNFANWSGDIVSDDLLELAQITYVKQRADATKFDTVAGKAKMISLKRAEELLAAGYVFGGHSCPLCMNTQEKIDFSDYDYVSMSYVTAKLFSDTPVPVVPFYVFYKYIEETENGKLIYAFTYVPAIEVSGLNEYFENQKSEHKQ